MHHPSINVTSTLTPQYSLSLLFLNREIKWYPSLLVNIAYKNYSGFVVSFRLNMGR